MTRRGIVLAGTAILDIVNIIDDWPAEEQVAFIQHTEEAAGGPPHNAAAGLVKLGADFPVTIAGVVGDDAYGTSYINQVKGYGLDAGRISCRPGTITSHTHVMSSKKTGKRTFFHAVGANALADVADLLPPASSTAKLFYLGSPGIAPKLDASNGWLTLLQKARGLGMKTCLELVPAPPETVRALVMPCLPVCDYLVINDSEAEVLVEKTVTRNGHLDWQAAEQACRDLLARGVGSIAAIHHPDGAVAVSASGETTRRGSVKVPAHEIVGSVGAGDAFYAGMLYGIHEGWPIEHSVDLANASAATSLHAATTSASIRPWKDCLAYAALHGLRPTG